MNRTLKAVAGALSLALATPAAASPAPEQASIAFPNYGGIRDWRAVDRDTLLIEGRCDQWYRAELFGPCIELPFAHAVGFVSHPGSRFDRFSKIVVRRETCQLRSLVKLDAPPSREREAA